MFNTLSRCFLILVASVALALPTWAAPNLADPLPTSPRLRLGKLPNGLTYYIQKNGKPANRVELRLVVKAGSVLEDEDQRGLAHFVEHMAFNGSRNFKKHELVSYFQSIGMRMGADLNAFTDYDSTFYVLSIPTDKPEHVETGFRVLEDWAQGVKLEAQAIDEERQIILQEMRQKQGFTRRVSELALLKLANGAPYGVRLPIGTVESITHNKPEALRRFYNDWYRPDLMAVIVVGDLDPDTAERYVRKHFSPLTMPAQPRPHAAPAVPPFSASEAVIYLDKEATSDRVELTYPLFQRPPDATVGDYRQSLVRALFASMLNDRMSRSPAGGNAPYVAASASVQATAFGRYQAYVARATIGKGGYGPAVDALVTQTERVRQFGFTPSELELARRRLIGGMEHAYHARDTVNSPVYVADYQRHFTTGEAIPGIENGLAYTKAFLPSVTLEEVHAYARSIILADAPKLVFYAANGTDGKPVPTREELLARVDAAHRLKVAQLADRGLPPPLMTTPPTPGSILEARTDTVLGTTRLTLSNGVKVVLKPTRFSVDTVQVFATRPGGHMLFADEDKETARFALSLQSSMGFGAFAPSELRRVLAGKRMTLTVDMNAYSDYLSGSCASGDVETLLQQLYVQTTLPRRDEALFRSYISSNTEQVRNAMFSPELRFAEARLRAQFADHPRVMLPPRPETFQSLNLDRAQAVYRSRMMSAKGMTFFFVGDFEVENIKPLLAGYLAALPVNDVPLAIRDHGIRQVPGVVKGEVRAGLEKKSLVTFDFSGDAPWSSQEDLSFRALIDVLNVRLRDTLRERDQLIYSAGVSGNFGKVPRGSYNIAFTFPTAPENADRVASALLTEITRLQNEGPGAEDLHKVRQAMLQTYRRQVNENAYWVQVLRGIEVDGLAPADILNAEQRIQGLTEAQVQAAARRYLNQENYLQMVLKPEA